MSPLEKLRQQLRDKKAVLDGLTAPTNEQGEVRDLTPEESTRFDAALAECNALKGRITALEALGDAPAANGPDQRSLPPQAPAVHTDEKRRPYSYLRAIRSRVQGMPLDGLEGEVAREIQVRTGKAPMGILVPTGADENIREMLRYGQPERRDLSSVSGSGSIFTVPRLPVIELLRARLVLAKLGADFIPNVQGNFAIPRQTGTTTGYFLAEGVPASLSNPTYDQVGFTPHVAIAATQITASFLAQTSLDADARVQDDLAATMARLVESSALNGPGTTSPQGLLQNPNVPVLPIGASGGTPTWGTVVGLEGAVANANADTGRLGYLTSPKVRQSLKQTLKTNTGLTSFIWEDVADGEGKVNSYQALTTSLIPTNLTKGSGTNLSALIYGNWSDLTIAMWEGVDMIINPFSGQLSGAITISNHFNMDCQVKHPQSFAVANDVNYGS